MPFLSFKSPPIASLLMPQLTCLVFIENTETFLENSPFRLHFQWLKTITIMITITTDPLPSLLHRKWDSLHTSSLPPYYSSLAIVPTLCSAFVFLPTAPLPQQTCSNFFSPREERKNKTKTKIKKQILPLECIPTAAWSHPCQSTQKSPLYPLFNRTAKAVQISQGEWVDKQVQV